MADSTRAQLEKAYNLIQKEELDQAIAILKPITEAQPNNENAWWLLANAVSEPPDAHKALKNVLRLNPRHKEARGLLDTLEQEFPYLTQNLQSDFADHDLSFDDILSGSAAQAASSTGGSSDIDDLFGSSGLGSTAQPANKGSDFGDIDIDSLFNDSPTPAGSNDPYGNDPFGASDPFGPSNSSPDSLEEYTSFDNFDNDPFANSEPAFMQDALNPPASEKPAKGRGEAKARPAKEPKQPKQPKPQAAPKEEVPADPFEMERRANRRRSPFVYVVLLLLLIVLVGGGLLAAYMTGIIGPKPGQPTAVVLDDSQFGVPTTDTSVARNAINARLAKEGFKQTSVVVGASALGDTLQASFCGNAGPRLNRDINKALDTIAKGAAAIRSVVKGAQLLVVSCSNPNLTLYRAIAPIDSINAYVDGGMTDARTFRASWKSG